jgi:hypothetical protein
MTAFIGQVRAMRTWMRDHGERQKPLVLSEWSLLYPPHLVDEYGNGFNNPQRVVDFLNDTIAYLSTATDSNLGYTDDGNRLVQSWNWFSVHNFLAGYISNLLLDDLQTPSPVGQAFQPAALSGGATFNLVPAWLSHSFAQSPTPGGSADVTLTAIVRNILYGRSATPFTVTFYENAALTQPIGQADVPGPGGDPPALDNCATPQATVSVIWQDVPPGYHEYWVKVDSGDTINESNEGDNVAKSFVIINPYQNYSPEVAGGG